jgi:hypothetical protein
MLLDKLEDLAKLVHALAPPGTWGYAHAPVWPGVRCSYHGCPTLGAEAQLCEFRMKEKLWPKVKEELRVILGPRHQRKRPVHIKPSIRVWTEGIDTALDFSVNGKHRNCTGSLGRVASDWTAALLDQLSRPEDVGPVVVRRLERQWRLTGEVFPRLTDVE